ncbi:MAG: hypothetical protein KAX19_12600, partial [Candidatus Brocadiae bacterium]|nr:hypothetical protein [Candidatus Brocadiia bacterium]
MRLLLDERADLRLRVWAAIVVKKLGSDEQVLSLESFVREHVEDGGDSYTPARVLLGALSDRAFWTVREVARCLPTMPAQWANWLVYALKKEMSVADARQVLDDWWSDEDSMGGPATEDLEASGRFHMGSRLAVLQHAVELVASQAEPSNEDYHLLLPLALNRGFYDRVLKLPEMEGLLRGNTAARRQLYQAGLSGRDGITPLWRYMLTGEDVEWLQELALRGETEGDEVWTTVLSLSRDGALSPAQAHAMRSLVQQHAPQVVALEEQQRDEWESRQRKREEEREKREREAPRDYPIAELVRETLDGNSDKREQMLRLAWFCFTGEHVRPSNLVGGWEDLAPGLKARVMCVCRTGLRDLTATPIPDGSSFPAAVMYEASCFQHMVEECPDYELTGEQIGRWLPAVLVLGDDWSDKVVQECFSTHSEAAEDVFAKDTARRLRSGSEYLSAISRLPAEYWSERLASKLAAFVEDDDLPSAGKESLLRLLGARWPDTAAPLAKAILPIDGHDLRLPALDVMLALEPDLAIPLLKAECAGNGLAVLVEMQSIYQDRGDLHARATRLEEDHVEALLDILYAVVPPSSDPDRTSGVARHIGAEDELRYARRDLTSSLLQAGTQEADAALDRLGRGHELIGDLVRHRDAETATTKLLSRPEKQRLPVQKVVRAIESADYRAIRTDEELLAALLEVLERIGETANQHLSMLYRPKERGAPRRRLHEDALQAYLHCRLHDMLADRVLDRETTVIANREDLAAYDRRFDLKIQAPKLGGGFATVVIEVKWSDNPTISTALSSQLGHDYLIGSNLTHGMYLVGWNGRLKWTSEAGSRSRDPTPEWLSSVLENQASTFMEKHPEVQIRPFVLDLTWED